MRIFKRIKELEYKVDKLTAENTAQSELLLADARLVQILIKRLDAYEGEAKTIEEHWYKRSEVLSKKLTEKS